MEYFSKSSMKGELEMRIEISNKFMDIHILSPDNLDGFRRNESLMATIINYRNYIWANVIILFLFY